MHGLLYVTASPLTDQPCDHDMLLRQSKESCDNCVTTSGGSRVLKRGFHSNTDSLPALT